MKSLQSLKSQSIHINLRQQFLTKFKKTSPQLTLTVTHNLPSKNLIITGQFKNKLINKQNTSKIELQLTKKNNENLKLTVSQTNKFTRFIDFQSIDLIIFNKRTETLEFFEIILTSKKFIS